VFNCSQLSVEKKKMTGMAVCSVKTFLSVVLFLALLGCFVLQVQVEVLCTVNVGTIIKKIL
jgi:hypothetical protein